MSESIDLKYPIGTFQPVTYSDKIRESCLADIKFLPQALEASVQNLDEHQLLTPYREGGWNVKQVVHHVADSHMNGYARIKLGLTEDFPTIKPYDEGAWAKMADVDQVPINVSLTLLHALHQRWYVIVSNIRQDEWDRKVFHPESKKEMSVWYLFTQYAWHGRHHTAHINRLRERMGWV